MIVFNVAALETAPGSSEWAMWDEVTESGWGDSGTFIALMEGASHEIGLGGTISGVPLSEANRTLTQIGGVGAAAGSPSKRAVTQVLHQGFTWPVAALEGYITGGQNFTFIWKWNGVSSPGAESGWLMRAYDATTTDLIQFLIDASEKLQLYVSDGGSVVVNGATTDSVPGTGYLYIAIWYDGTFLRWGFTATKPTKWSDFAANSRGSATVTFNLAESDNDYRILGANSAYPACGSFYYFLASHTVLIANNL